MRNSVFIKIQTIPVLEQVKERDRVSEPHLEIRPDTLAQMFQLANLREQRKDRFNQHPLVPLVERANLQIFRLIRASAKTVVRQDNHFLTHSFNQRQKFRVRDIRRLDLPVGNKSELVGNQTQTPFSSEK